MVRKFRKCGAALFAERAVADHHKFREVFIQIPQIIRDEIIHIAVFLKKEKNPKSFHCVCSVFCRRSMMARIFVGSPHTAGLS